jgi:hypothetical protein
MLTDLFHLIFDFLLVNLTLILTLITRVKILLNKKDIDYFF